MGGLEYDHNGTGAESWGTVSSRISKGDFTSHIGNCFKAIIFWEEQVPVSIPCPSAELCWAASGSPLCCSIWCSGCLSFPFLLVRPELGWAPHTPHPPQPFPLCCAADSPADFCVRPPKTLRQPVAAGRAPALQQPGEQDGLSLHGRLRRQGFAALDRDDPAPAAALPGGHPIRSPLLPWCLPGSGSSTEGNSF